MRITRQKQKIKALTVSLAPALFVLLLLGSFFSFSTTVSAETRLEHCQSLPAGPPAPGANSEDTSAGCLQKLDTEAWNACISKPEAERGQCATDYKAAPEEKENTTASLDTGGKAGTCGGGADAVKTMINIGCRGQGNPILDMTFAIIRVLSVGVGIVVIGSFIVAGIQYITSAGEPAATAKAIERIRNTFFALLLYIFAYAILNWLVPAGLLQ